MIQESKEQQQMYNLFRSFIYIFLIVELVMHMPVHTGSSIANSFLQMIARLGFFNSVVSCKVIELVTILITCAGTTARRSLKFDVRTMVVYPCVAGITLTVLCIFLQQGHWGTCVSIEASMPLPSISTASWVKTDSTSRTRASSSVRNLLRIGTASISR